MWTARITMQGVAVDKDEIKMEDLENLLTALIEIYDNTVLEIYIYREDKK